MGQAKLRGSFEERRAQAKVNRLVEDAGPDPTKRQAIRLLVDSLVSEDGVNPDDIKIEVIPNMSEQND